MDRLEQLRKLAAAQPDDPLAHYGVGLECAERELWEDALQAFARTLACDSEYSAAFLQQARAELKLGRRDAARCTVEAGLSIATRRGESHTADKLRELLESLA